MIELLFRAILVYIVARVITQEQITEWFRLWLFDKAKTPRSAYFFLHKLFSCIFCLSFYVAIALVIFLPGELFWLYEIPTHMFFVAIANKGLE